MKKPAAQKSALKKNGGLDSTSTEAGSVLADSVGSSSSADELPGKKEIAAVQATVRAFMNSRRQARVRSFLERLSGSPPQVLLLEGGTADDRLAAAHYWSLLLNCPTATGWTAPDPRPGSADEPPAPAQGGLLNLLPGVSPGGQAAKAPQAVLQGMVKEDSLTGVCAPDRGVPCLDCPECIRLLTHLHRDCFFFDGLAGSIKIDEVRAMRVVLGEPAREARHRVVIFREAQSLVEAAANALLKSFEEPRPGTSFVLLAPQRERLLPTLVSRSFVLTLPWKREADPEQRESLAPWEAALCTFLRTGRDFLERSAGKGAVDAALVHDLTNLCRRALAGRLSALQSGNPPEEGLESLLARLPVQRLRMLDEALAECQDSLMYNVNPVLVLEWLATRMYLLLPRTAAGER